MPKQINTGKSFEYAMLLSVCEVLSANQEVVVVENTSLEIAKSAFYNQIELHQLNSYYL